jgi:exopolysaccharide production protein ExoQ
MDASGRFRHSYSLNVKDEAMERRAYEAPLDPALAVSGLLTRLGLFLLVIFAPFFAMFSRHAVAIIVPIATALLIMAAALDGRLPMALHRLTRSLLSYETLALFLLMIWAAITIFWTPQPSAAAGQLPSILLVVLLFAVTISCLKGNVRFSDVNLIPIGLSIAAVALILEFLPYSPLRGLGEVAGENTESVRAAMLLALLIWPAVGAVLARGRSWQALLMCLVTILALWLVHSLVVFTAFLTGIMVMTTALWRPRLAARLVGIGALVLLVLAPLAGWLMARYGGFLLPAEGDHLVAVWRDVTFSLPTHLIAGYGFDASASLTRGVGGQLLASPRNAALQVWLELGLIGVLLAAMALWLTFRGMDRDDDRSVPAALAVSATAVVMMFAGLASWQTWWLMALGLTSVSLAFLARLGARRRRD